MYFKVFFFLLKTFCLKQISNYCLYTVPSHYIYISCCLLGSKKMKKQGTLTFLKIIRVCYKCIHLGFYNPINFFFFSKKILSLNVKRKKYEFSS